MRPYVIINGVNSNTITGLIISKLPPVTKPQMRVLTEQIDGRDGDINTPLGFSAYDKPLEIGLTAEADVNEVIAYFNQAGKIIFSNEPDKYYNFAIYDAIDFEKLIRFKTATINLHTQPYKYSSSQGAIALNSGSNTVVNSGNTVSKPDLILEGSGVVNLSINNRQIIEADLTDVNNILIDSDTMNAYEINIINPIKSLKSDINPVQSGTGTPSPDNVRPISGFSALNVTLADGDMQTVDTKTVNFGQTVYGGVADVTNGKVTVNDIYLPVMANYFSGIATTSGVIRAYTTPQFTDRIISACDCLDINGNSATVNSIFIAGGRICVTPAWGQSVTTIDEFKTLLASNPINIVISAATPIEITTTPENLTAISGENNVYSDTNGDTEVKVDIDGEEQTLTGEIVTFNIDELDYELGAFANRIVTGNYDNIKLEVGSNNVELTGAFTDGQLTKYSRWL